MFNPDFYPTPSEVIDLMLNGTDVSGKVVLEPSAGKGNIVDALRKFGAKQILTFEKEPDLQIILESKSKVLGSDFLKCTKEDISHINFIIMNPPFSAGGEHILHAWDIAPEGCQIVSLCNTNTVKVDYTRERRVLGKIIKDYGSSDELGDCFSNSERKTGVEISLVRLYKPIVSEDFNWDGFFIDEEEETVTGPGIMPYNEIRSIVNTYKGAVNCFDELKSISEKMNNILKPIGLNSGFGCSISYDKKSTTKEEFSKDLQKEGWKWIFKKMNIGKFVTSGVMQDINKFVEQQQQIPFTMKNIYRMFEIIVGTREQTMNRAMEEVFDKLTKHHHDNRYAVEGWKTNSHYLVNKKFILEYVTELAWSGGYMTIKSYNGNQDKMTDLNKALCWLTGEDNGLGELYYFPGKETNLQFNTWYDWGFFEIKGFKKGTLHCKFKDENVWALFNRKIAEIKGFPLPEKL